MNASPVHGTTPDSELGDWSKESPYAVRLEVARSSMDLLGLSALQAAEAYAVQVDDLQVDQEGSGDANN